MSDAKENYDEAFNRVIGQYYEVANSDVRGKIQLQEELIRLADSAGDIHNGFNIRMEMVRLGTFADQKEKALVAFSWCLAQADRNPHEFDQRDLLWRYKWILENIRYSSRVPKTKILELFNDFQKRLSASQFNMRSANCLGWSIAMGMGELDRAREFHTLWKKDPRDALADCHACEQNKLSKLYGVLGEPERALEVAEPLLGKKLTCAEIPHNTYGHIIRQFWRLGRIDEVLQLQPDWYRITKDNPEFMIPVSEQMLLLAAKGSVDDSFAIFERHVTVAAETTNEHNRFCFFDAARILFRKIAASGQDEIKTDLPDSFTCKLASHTYQASTLEKWFSDQAHSIAARFDTRNETLAYRERMADTDSLAG